MGQLFILDGRHRPPLATYPGTHAGHMCRFKRSSAFPYLVLLQAGFTLPPALTGAVRSYRTFSPLPPPQVWRFGGMFSVALSVSSHPPGVTWRPALWSPDFPLP